MTNTLSMMGNSQENVNLIGPACQADGWQGHVDGLHTVVFQVVNFTGRLFIEATLEVDPKEEDWFAIPLGPVNPWIQFPTNFMMPTGAHMGDTKTLGVTFYTNAIWLRARLDRDYLKTSLYSQDPRALSMLGNVAKITLAR